MNASPNSKLLTRSTFGRFLVIIALSILGALMSGQSAKATSADLDPNSAFCLDVLAIQFIGVGINMDNPDATFFNDGNLDGIADPFQSDEQRSNFANLVTELNALADEAPSDLQEPLRTLASQIEEAASKPVPTTPEESETLVASIESTAAVLQPQLAACHTDFVSQPEAPDGASIFNGFQIALAIGGTVLFFLANLPLIIATLRAAPRTSLNPEATAFTGPARQWQVGTITGRVLNSSGRAITSVTSSVAADGGTDVRSRTTITETLRLSSADGAQADVTLIDFSASPTNGDVVTVGSARKNSQEVTWALLNHTTQQSIVAPSQVAKFRSAGAFGQFAFIMSLVGALVVTLGTGVVLIAFGIFIGFLMILVTFALVIAYVVFARRVVHVNLDPLWRRAAPEAQRLPATQ